MVSPPTTTGKVLGQFCNCYFVISSSAPTTTTNIFASLLYPALQQTDIIRDQHGPLRMHGQPFYHEVGAYHGAYEGCMHTGVLCIGFRILTEAQQDGIDLHGFYCAMGGMDSIPYLSGKRQTRELGAFFRVAVIVASLLPTECLVDCTQQND